MSTDFNQKVPWQSESRIWLPPPTVTEHTGAPLSAEYLFSLSPPDEIGEVRSAYSSVKRGEREFNTPRARLRAVAVAFAFGVAVAIGLELAAHVLTQLAEETHLPRPFWAMLPGALLGLLLWRLTRSSGLCNFVGSTGCAEVVGAAGGGKLLRRRFLRFQDAAGLTVNVARHFQRTEYRYTDFYFRWYAPGREEPAFEITGSHAANLETPPPANYYHFGRAAESAWCAFRAPYLDTELAQNGYVRFILGGKRAVRVGQGFMAIEEAEGTCYRAEASEIGTVKMQSGLFTLTRKEGSSGFFGKLGESGSFYFDLGTMHNSRLFLLAFDKLLGLKIS